MLKWEPAATFTIALAGKFALPEADNAEIGGLTHLGNPLSTLDDFKGTVPEAEDDDEGGVYELSDARVVAAAHFGGGAEPGADRRTKKEVMAEVMAVSKAARAEKRMLKEEDEGLLDAVDERWTSLLQVRPATGPAGPALPLHCAVVQWGVACRCFCGG